MAHFLDGAFSDGPLPLDPSAQDGLFETLLFNGKRLMHAQEHMRRIRRSLDALARQAELPRAAALERMTLELLEAEGLRERTARVNLHCLFAASGSSRVLVSVWAFDPQPERSFALLPVRLDPGPERLHKVTRRDDLNQALARALAAGYDDALLHDREGRMLETSYAALLFRINGQLLAPAGCNLPSTALAAVRDVLALREEELFLSDLGRAEHVYLLNALRGVRPVVRVGEHGFASDEDTCRRGTECVTGKR